MERHEILEAMDELKLYGAPFKNWDLPPALAQVRSLLKSHIDGDRQFVKVLAAVPDHGLAAVEAACAEALAAGIAGGLRRGAGGRHRLGRCDPDRPRRQHQPAAPPSTIGRRRARRRNSCRTAEAGCFRYYRCCCSKTRRSRS